MHVNKLDMNTKLCTRWQQHPYMIPIGAATWYVEIVRLWF